MKSTPVCLTCEAISPTGFNFIKNISHSTTEKRNKLRRFKDEPFFSLLKLDFLVHLPQCYQSECCFVIKLFFNLIKLKK